MTLPLEYTDVSKSFAGKPAVRDVSFSVAPGEIVGFLGPNGAGKTTTIRMGLGIVRPDTGSVRLFGERPGPSAFGRIGFLPEERGLYKKQTTREAIAQIARLNGVPGAQALAEAERLLARYGLGDVARSKVKTLSKGMAQKVQLLAAISHRPEFSILDEPFSGLDPVNQKVLEDLIAELRADGTTIVFSTHVMAHAERLCDRFLMIAHGRRVFEGTLDDARARRGRRLVLTTPDDPQGLTRLPEVDGVEPLGGGAAGDDRYAIALADGADPQRVLSACLTQGIRVTGFGAETASLHDLFFEFAGAAPAPALASESEAA